MFIYTINDIIRIVIFMVIVLVAIIIMIRKMVLKIKEYRTTGCWNHKWELHNTASMGNVHQYKCKICGTKRSFKWY